MSRHWVVKVGGSLLDWTDLRERLFEFLDGMIEQGRSPVMVVGGGRVADAVRELDRVHLLGESCAHRLALRALDLTAHALAAILPGANVIEDIGDLGGSSSRFPVLATRRLLDEDDRRGEEPLPHHWDVTSDSIAARAAFRLGAEGLSLLKSVSLPAGVDRETAARLGLVDPMFPKVSRHLARVEYRNFREHRSTGQAF